MDEAVAGLRADYDAVPFESRAIPLSAPEHLAAIAHVFGLDPTQASHARVLEIGCSDGGNLIPFALNNPAAQVVGIDLSEVQIQQGRARVHWLGVTNLTLLQGDIASMNLSDFGQFDYIICHRVFSLVPEHVQEAILATFQRLLAPNGIAYISYNVYPGWKAKELVRDAMLLRGGDKTDPVEKLSYARGMIDFLEKVAPADSVLAKVLADDRASGLDSGDSYVLHGHLETFNQPCYFLEFGSRCEPYALTYLADALVQNMFAINYGSDVAEPLIKECGHSQILLEQYLDFVVNRSFRQSLLVHAASAEQWSYQIDRKRFGTMHFAAWLPPIGDPTRLDNSNQEYGFSGLNLATPDPGLKAAVDALTARWPWTLSRPDLLLAVHKRLAAAGLEPIADQHAKIDDLLEALVVRGMARYRLAPVAPPPMGDRLELAEPFRRMVELVRRQQDARIVNRWHEEVLLPPVDRHLLPLLDGTRDREALADELMALLHADVIGFVRDGHRLWGEVELRTAAREYVDGTRARLTQMRLA